MACSTRSRLIKPGARLAARGNSPATGVRTSRVCSDYGLGSGAAVYDYVIVGAGSAGCVLAARLTENPAASVLLLEAGPPDTPHEIHMPPALNLLFPSSYDWGFRTLPQDKAARQSRDLSRGPGVRRSCSL